MKYVVILGDGMADYPVSELGGRTPLEVATKPCVDSLAGRGVLGLAKTIPEDLPAGSDVANLSVMGYNPHHFYSGRSPLEAASMGIELEDSDITFRVNLVTLSEGGAYRDKTILDHSAGEITTEEGRVIIQDIGRHLGTDRLSFYPGVSYRHLLVWSNGPDAWELTPPHDVLGQTIESYLPKGEEGALFLSLMERSFTLLEQHPLNVKRKAEGLNPANSLWIWGEGKKPRIQSFADKYQVDGAVISAVDLIKGLGICAGLDSIDVPGATGNFHTNYRGKAQAALDALRKGKKFIFVHIEAPDECGHRNELDNKVKSIELIDREVVTVMVEALEEAEEDYSLMFLPDHATPLSLRTHTRDAVPFLVYRKHDTVRYPGRAFTEHFARESGLILPEGHRLMDFFLRKEPFPAH